MADTINISDVITDTISYTTSEFRYLFDGITIEPGTTKDTLLTELRKNSKFNELAQRIFNRQVTGQYQLSLIAAKENIADEIRNINEAGENLRYQGSLGEDVYELLKQEVMAKHHERGLLGKLWHEIDTHLIKGIVLPTEDNAALGRPMHEPVSKSMRRWKGLGAAISLGAATYMSHGVYKNLMGEVNERTGERDTDISWTNVGFYTLGAALGVQGAKFLTTGRHRWGTQSFAEIEKAWENLKRIHPEEAAKILGKGPSSSPG